MPDNAKSPERDLKFSYYMTINMSRPNFVAHSPSW